MRRQIARRATPSVSLFPFLAVLICTMGALIVLLVLVVQMARVQADTISEDRQRVAKEREGERKQRLQEQEDFDWQREVLLQQRGELTGRLADRRRELSHLEEHIRRLERKLEQLRAEAADLARDGQAGSQSEAAITGRLQEIQAQMDSERERLKKARKEVAERRQSYAVIPYQGPNTTRRRPIYIECTRTGILLQPEGIVLRPEDFSGPLGPGNPLDAALRTISEHWQRTAGTDTAERPYPLLIVRSNGPVAYSMARAAMVSWEDEFGYELIEDDTRLAYPPPDPELKRLLEATIRTARHRQALLAAAMPSRFGGAAPGEFAVEPAEPYAGGSSGGGAASGNPAAAGRAVGGGRAAGERGAAFAAAGPGASSGPSGSPGGSSAADPPVRIGDGGGGPPGERSPEAVGGMARGTAGGAGRRAGAPGGGFYTEPYQAGSAVRRPSHAAAASRTAAASEPGAAARGTGAPSAGGSVSAADAAAAGRPAALGQSGAAGAGGTSPGSPSAAAAGSFSEQSRNGSPGGTRCSAAGGASGFAATTQPLAAARGQDWALPQAEATATGITRPILAECHPDRIILRTERRSGFAPQVITFDGPAGSRIDQVVAGIQQHVQQWGMAVAGGYWKPVLRCEVFPQAEGRFWELKTLLEGSGIVVEQR